MNKKFLLVAALCAAMNLSSFAQENLALGKTVVASSATTAEPATNIVDGDLNTRWQVDTGQEIEQVTTDYTVTSGHWIYVDLGEKKDFNTIRIRWEGAYAKEFKVLVAEDVNAETGEPNWKDEAILSKEESLTDFSQYYTYSLDNTVNARFVKLQAVKLGYDGNWFSMYEMGIYNVSAEEKTPVITSMTASKSFVSVGESFTVTIKDQFDKVMTDGITYELTNATQQADGTFKADAAGEVVIKATDTKGNTKTVKAYAVTDAPATPTLGADDMPIFINNTDGLGTYNAGWEGGYTDNTLMDINGKAVYAVTQVATFGWKKNAISDTDYEKLNFDILSTQDLNDVYVQYEDAKIADKHFSVKAGEWTHVSLDIDGGAAYNGYIKFKLADQNSAKADRADVLLANVYLTKAAASTGVVIGKADDKGVASVKGTLTVDELQTLAKTEGTAFDLTNLTIADDVNISDIKFQNPNAIVVVPGEVDRTDNKNTLTYDEKWKNLTNAVLKSGDGYFYPIAQLQISDKNPVYRTFYISGAVGYKYTRSLAAKTYSTVYLNDNADVPTGCKVYEFTADAENANNVVLKETAAINGLTPYLIYNGNNTEAELVCETNGGDINFTAADNTKEVGFLNVIGTFDYFTGADKADIYAIQNQTSDDITLKKVGENAKVSPFRVYFTLKPAAGAKPVTFSFEGGATGIKDITTADAAKAGNIYSIDGKLVKKNATTAEGLAKGVYVINGKKYIVK